MTSITLENYFTRDNCLRWSEDAHLDSFRIPSLAIRFGSIVQSEADLCSSASACLLRSDTLPPPFCRTRAVMLKPTGVNIGALTVKVVRADAKNANVMAHQGRPLEVLEQLLAMPEFADAEYFGVSGSWATSLNLPLSSVHCKRSVVSLMPLFL